MKVLYATVIDVSTAEGAAEHVIGVSRGMAQLGHEVHLVARASQPADADRRLECADLVFHRVDEPPLSVLPWTFARITGRVLQLLDEREFDCVYLRNFALSYPFLVARMARRGVPVFCELNTISEAEYRARGKHWRAGVYTAMEALTLRACKGWLPVTEEVNEYARRITRTRRPYLLAKNGIWLDRVEPTRTREQVRAVYGSSPDQFVIVMAGFSRPWHGADRALEMLTMLEGNVEMWLVGARDEEEKARYQAQADALGVGDAVRVLPWLNQAELADVVNAADLGLGALALDRNDMSESQSVKVSLYLAAGVPVLVNTRDVRLDPSQPFVESVLSTEPREMVAAIERIRTASSFTAADIRDYARRHVGWSGIAEETACFLNTHVD